MCDICAIKSSSSPPQPIKQNDRVCHHHRTSSTIDSLSDMSTGGDVGRSRANSTSSVMTSSDNDDDYSESSQVDDDDDDHDDDDDVSHQSFIESSSVDDEFDEMKLRTERHDVVEVWKQQQQQQHQQKDELGLLEEDDEAKTKAPSKKMGRLRRFSLNLSFLRSKRDGKQAENEQPVTKSVIASLKSELPTSASLTNDVGSENLRRFYLNKRLLSIIRKKKVNKKVNKEVEVESVKPLSNHYRSLSLNTLRLIKSDEIEKRSKSYDNLTDLHKMSMVSSLRQRGEEETTKMAMTLTNRIAIPTPTTKIVAQTTNLRPSSPRSQLFNKKFSLPMYMASRDHQQQISSSSIGGVTVGCGVNQIAMSSSTKFSTSEAETIVLANYHRQNTSGSRSSKLTSELYQQLSYSPTIVNACGMIFNFLKILVIYEFMIM